MEIIKKENKYSGFLNFEVLDVKLKSGDIISREIIRKKNGVAILAIDDDNQIYLTKQPRVGANLDESIEIPAGIVEEGENVEEAAKRELLEETGCECSNLISLGEFFGDVACCNSKTYLYLAMHVKKVKDLELDDDEFLTSFTTPKNKVYEMLENGELKDAHTTIALLKAKKYLVK